MKMHEEKGVAFHTGVGVTELIFDAANNTVSQLRLTDGTLIDADIVVLGIGGSQICLRVRVIYTTQFRVSGQHLYRNYPKIPMAYSYIAQAFITLQFQRTSHLKYARNRITRSESGCDIRAVIRDFNEISFYFKWHQLKAKYNSCWMIPARHFVRILVTDATAAPDRQRNFHRNFHENC